MNSQEFKKIANEKLSKLSVNDLIIEVKKLKDNCTTDANLISNCILDILIEKMTENEFVELCNEL